MFFQFLDKKDQVICAGEFFSFEEAKKFSENAFFGFVKIVQVK